MKATEMSQSNHTPGPWNYDGVVINTPDGMPVHCKERSREELRANARLIAAAPDLLEALRVLVLLVPKTSIHLPAIAQAEAAIEKAMR